MPHEHERTEQKPEELRHSIEETRASLTEKVSILEDQVRDTVSTARESVTGAFDSVKGSVEAIKRTFDVEHQVQCHPWAMFAGSVVCGLLAGRYLGSVESSRAEESSGNGRRTRRPSAHREAVSIPQRGATARIMDRFHDEISDLRRLAVGTLMGVGRDILKQSLPPPWSESVERIADSATEKLGGRPLPGPLVKWSS